MSKPSLSRITYNATTGLITVVGKQLLINQPILLDHFSFIAGSQRFNFSSINESILNVTADGFNVQLNSTDQSLVNGFFSLDGTTNNSYSYRFAASSGWDAGQGSQIANMPVTVTGGNSISLTGFSNYTAITDISSLNLFKNVTIKDSNSADLVSASIRFLAANGILYSNKLSAGTPSGDYITYTLPATSASLLQQALHAIQFYPTKHQVAPGQSVTSNFALTVTGDASALDVVSNSSTQVKTTAVAPATITSVSYNSATLQITLYGNHFTNNANFSDYDFGTLTFIGQNKASYTIHPYSYSQTDITSNKIVFDIYSTDRVGLKNVFNQNGKLGLDGSYYQLSVPDNWDIGAKASIISNVTVSGLVTPSMTSVSYDASLGKLTVQGQNLTSYGKNILVDHFSIHAGSNAYTLQVASDTVSKLSANGFTVTLNDTDKNLVYRFLTTDKNHPAYTFATTAGWADNSGSAYNNVSLQLSNANSLSVKGLNVQNSPISDQSSVSPFSSIILSDTNSKDKLSASITFSAAVGRLTGTGLSSGVITDDKITYTLSATTPALLQTALQKLVFTPTTQVDKAGQLLSNTISLTITDSHAQIKFSGANTVQVQASSAALTGVAYDAQLGQLTLTGPHFSSNPNDFNLTDFTLTGQKGLSYTLTGGSIASLQANTLVVNLTSTDQAALSDSLNYAGVYASDATPYQFSAQQGWDAQALAVSGLAITVSNAKMIDTDVILPFSHLQLSAQQAVQAQIAFPAVNGSLLGLNNTKPVIDQGNAVYTVTAVDNASLLKLLQQVQFVPTLHQVATGQSVTTNFNLQFTYQANSQPALTLSSSDGISSPECVVVNSNGNIWVANSWENTLTEFTAQGKQVFSTHYQGVGSADLALDSNDNVWAILPYQQSVEKFDTHGNEALWLYVGFNASDVATDLQGNAYITSSNSNIVDVSSSQGVLSHQFTASDGLNIPGKVSVDANGNIFIPNFGNNTVQEFSSHYDLLRTLTTGIAQPQAVITDQQGNVYIANGQNSTVEKFSANGVLLATLTDHINSPYLLAIDSLGNLFVANTGDSITEFNSSGVLQATISNSLSGVYSMSVDSTGNLYVANRVNSSVVKFAATTNNTIVTTNADTPITVYGSPTEISSVNYNATTGQLVFTGQGFSTDTSLYPLADFTVTGDQGLSYTLTNSLLDKSINTKQFSINLSAQDKLAINGLFNKAGTTAQDGSAYSVMAATGWNPLANAMTLNNVSVNHPQTPTITGANYSVKTGALTVTGTNFVNLGNHNGIQLDRFSLTNGVNQVNLHADSDSVSQLSANSFTVTLSKADKTLLNGLFSHNSGVAAAAGYALNVVSGWDADNGLAQKQALNVTDNVLLSVSAITSPMTIKDVDTVQPFATIKITDSNSTTYDSASISFAQANGSLSGPGLAVTSVNNGIITYSLPHAPLADLILALRQVTFTPSLNQRTTGGTTNTDFSLAIQDGSLDYPVSSDMQIKPSDMVIDDIAVDAQGNILVTDGFYSRSLYSASGNLLYSFDDAVYSIAHTSPVFDSQGNSYFGSSNSGNVQEYNSSGTLIHVFPGIEYATTPSIAIDNSDHLYVLNRKSDNSSSIQKYSTSGELLNTFSVAGIPKQFLIDQQGHVLITTTIASNSSYSYEVIKYAADGSVIFTLNNGTYPQTPLAYNNYAPNSIAVDNQGNLFAADQNSRAIVEYTSAGKLLRTIQRDFSGSCSLTTNSIGELFVANPAKQTIAEYASTGVLLHTFSASNAVKYSYQFSLATDANNNLYRFDGFDKVIEKFSANINDGSVLITHSQLNVIATNPQLSAVSYDASSGSLTLTGQNFTVNVSDYLATAFTFTGWNANSYTLTGGTITPSTDHKQLEINLNSTDQLALAALFNQNGQQAVGGGAYTLSVNTNWDIGASAVNNLAVTAKNIAAPHIDQVSYDYSLGILHITAKHLAYSSDALGIQLTGLNLTAGLLNYNLASDANQIVQISQNGFDIHLTSAAQANVNAAYQATAALLNNNQMTFTASANWDAGFADAVSKLAVSNVTGLESLQLTGLNTNVTLTDQQTSQPFSGLQLTDSYPNNFYKASVSLNASAGILTGNQLSAGISHNGLLQYNLVSTSLSSLQQALQNLKFTPTEQALAAGAITDTNINLSVSSFAYLPDEQPIAKVVTDAAFLDQIAWDNNGDYYVNHPYHYSLEKFSATGQLLNTIPIYILQTSLMVDNSNNVYVLGQNFLEKYSASGALQFDISTGSGINTAVVTVLNHIYIINSYSGLVSEYSTDGVLLKSFTNSGYYPYQIAVDSQSHVYINYGSSTGGGMLKYNADLQLIPGFSIKEPVLSMKCDAQDNLWCICSPSIGTQYALKEYNSAGVLLQAIDIGSVKPSSDVVFDQYGNVFVASNKVYEYSPTGALLQTFNTGAKSMMIDGNGDLSVAHYNGTDTLIEKYSPLTNTSSISNAATHVSITTSVNHFAVQANPTIDTLTTLTAHHGDNITIADANSFKQQAAVNANVVSANGGDSKVLADWVQAALSSNGANLASQQIGWFQFQGDTYLLEQANNQGSSYAAGDTLVKLVGLFDESNAVLSGHTLIL